MCNNFKMSNELECLPLGRSAMACQIHCMYTIAQEGLQAQRERERGRGREKKRGERLERKGVRERELEKVCDHRQGDPGDDSLGSIWVPPHTEKRVPRSTADTAAATGRPPSLPAPPTPRRHLENGAAGSARSPGLCAVRGRLHGTDNNASWSQFGIHGVR